LCSKIVLWFKTRVEAEIRGSIGKEEDISSSKPIHFAACHRDAALLHHYFELWETDIAERLRQRINNLFFPCSSLFRCRIYMVICFVGELRWIKILGRLTETRNAIEHLVSYLWIVLVIVHI